MEFSYKSTNLKLGNPCGSVSHKILRIKNIGVPNANKGETDKEDESDWPFARCFQSPYESEASCLVFIMKICFHSLHEVFIFPALYLDSIS